MILKRCRTLMQGVIFTSAFFALTCVPVSIFGQDTAVKPHYSVAQVLPVAVQPGVTISADYASGMAERVAHALEGSKRFATVVQSPDITTAQTLPTLRIAMTITKFNPGNRAERALIGFGAGATKITVHVVFTDAATAKVLLEQDVKGLIWFGSALKGFGNPNSAQKDIATNIKDIAIKHF